MKTWRLETEAFGTAEARRRQKADAAEPARLRKENKRGFVTAHKAQYAVSTLCRVPGISRGWFYGFLASQPARDQRQANRDARDPDLLPGIRTFFKAGRKCYGSKRIHQDPVADGETVSERRVARIMKENKVSPRPNKRRKPVTTDSNHNMSPSANLLEQDFHCLTPNAVWLVDITCIDTDEGWQCDPPNRTVLIRPLISGYPPTPSPGSGLTETPGRMDRRAKGMLIATGSRSRCSEITGPSRRGRLWVSFAALTHFCVAFFLRFVSFQIFVPGNTLTPLINFFPTEI